jgi:hypothetical protein
VLLCLGCCAGQRAAIACMRHSWTDQHLPASIVLRSDAGLRTSAKFILRIKSIPRLPTSERAAATAVQY